MQSSQDIARLQDEVSQWQKKHETAVDSMQASEERLISTITNLKSTLASVEEMSARQLNHDMQPFQDVATLRDEVSNISIKRRLIDLHSLVVNYGSRIYDSFHRNWEPPIDRDKVRIRWICRCGRMLWDDFKELRPSAAEDLCRCVEFYESSRSAQEINNPHRTPKSSSLGRSAPGSAAGTPALSYAGAPDHLLSTIAAASGIVTTERQPTEMSIPGAKFLLLCFRKPGDTLRLDHLNVENVTTDFQLFQLLRAKYRTYQGLSVRMFSPRKLRSVLFRKLERHPRERVVIRPSPPIVPRCTDPDACHKDHVPKCDTEYDSHPTPPDLAPYVGPNGLEYLLNHPHEAEEQGNNLPVQDVWLKRFPKREESKLTVCPPYQHGLGWGVEFEEVWHFSWILKVTLHGIVLAATISLGYWWSIRGDIQGSTDMAALLVSYCVLLITLFSTFAIA